VGRGRETDNENRCSGVAEGGHGPPPVFLLAKSGSLLARDALAPFDESGAAPARDETPLEHFQVRFGQSRSFARRETWCSIVFSRYNTSDLDGTTTPTPE
jgi:hypothetical protein